MPFHNLCPLLSFQVVTVESVPFVYKRNYSINDTCNESSGEDLNKEVPCNHTDPVTGHVTQYCCYGYNIDLLRLLALRSRKGNGVTPFSYTLHLVGDGEVGKQDVSDHCEEFIRFLNW